MKMLKHPNILRIHDIYEDLNNIYLILDYCSGGELYQRLNNVQKRGMVFSETRVRLLMRQILSALAYMHANNILHKDLKPENIMFVDSSIRDHLVIIDFGLSEIFEKSQTISHHAGGTVLYMAPEVFSRKLSFKSDVWSAGCIMFLLLTGYLPFSGRTITEVNEAVNNSNPKYQTRCTHCK
uniref:Calcium-dependent protein kinase 1-like n=1 Tax=Dermatophagoides pteronyssinus TaxID=6956 RepID=A0A6P6XP42_DERPT|nr:calcium-dependent protein kinase 1-like [Dermatophagoides pteronyssinus]